MNPTIDCIMGRQSQRVYEQIPVSDDHREQIIACALRAPTAGNMMLYSIIEVVDQEKKNRLVTTCDNQPFIAKAPFVLLFLADLQRWYDFYHHTGVAEMCRQQGTAFTRPEEADLMLASCDALIAAQNAVIAAESLGVGSCYIGDIMENYEIHRDLFSLPSLVFPITMLCFGYPKKRQKPLPYTPRFPRESVVFKDQYKRLESDDFEEMFRSRLAHQFADGRFMAGAENIGQHFYLKKTGAPFFQEMRRSVKVALASWIAG